MTNPTPICDLIAKLLTQGTSPGDAIEAARAVEAALPRMGGSTADQRQRWRIKAQRKRDRQKNVSGRREGGDIESSTSTNTQKVLKKESKKDSVTPRVSGDVLSDWPPDYAKQFWDNCPRKVEKVEAMKCLDRVRRTGVAWSVFFAGVLRWSAASVGREKRYVKHPTTWLNKGCWTDEIDGGGTNGPTRPSRGSSFSLLAAQIRNAHAPVRDDGPPAGGEAGDRQDGPPRNVARH